MEFVLKEESGADAIDPGPTLSKLTVGAIVITMVTEALVRLFVLGIDQKRINLSKFEAVGI